MNISESLIKSIATKKCVLLVGSGLSRNTHRLPTWNDFVSRIKDSIGDDENESDSTHENLQNYRLEYLEYIKNSNPVLFDNAVKDILQPTNNQPVHDIHKIISEIPWAAVITTNLDTLIEDAFKHYHVKHIVVDGEQSIVNVGNESGTLIIKMHGRQLHAKMLE